MLFLLSYLLSELSAEMIPVLVHGAGKREGRRACGMTCGSWDDVQGGGREGKLHRKQMFL